MNTIEVRVLFDAITALQAAGIHVQEPWLVHFDRAAVPMKGDLVTLPVTGATSEPQAQFVVLGRGHTIGRNGSHTLQIALELAELRQP
jgi:hypothetical protein